MKENKSLKHKFFTKFIRTSQFILLGGMLMFAFGCNNGSGYNNSESEYNGMTEVHMTYDNFSGDQFFMDADVVKISDKGASVKISKRVGPNNYTGKKKEGTIKIDKNQVDELFDILERYDLEGYTQLPAGGSIGTPSRTLSVLKKDDLVYHVSFNTYFPKTLPPEEDIMYFELYNFFNDLIANESGWEEVVGDNLSDPREEPAYYERTVTWFGKEVNLVPGTGVGYKNGKYGQIDYEDKNWWIEEGFVGEWTLDKENSEDVSDALLIVNEDGTIVLTTDGIEYKGELSKIRRYMDDVDIYLQIEGRDYGGSILMLNEESYGNIRLECYPLPYPELQFDPVDVYLMKK